MRRTTGGSSSVQLAVRARRLLKSMALARLTALARGHIAPSRSGPRTSPLATSATREFVDAQRRQPATPLQALINYPSPPAVPSFISASTLAERVKY